MIFSTPFDETAVDLLQHLKTPAYKVASFELTDIPLLKYISKTKKTYLNIYWHVNSKRDKEFFKGL